MAIKVLSVLRGSDCTGSVGCKHCPDKKIYAIYHWAQLLKKTNSETTTGELTKAVFSFSNASSCFFVKMYLVSEASPGWEQGLPFKQNLNLLTRVLHNLLIRRFD